jgi:hypothetical protein
MMNEFSVWIFVSSSQLPEQPSNEAHGTRVLIDATIFVYDFSADSRLNSACTGFLASVEQGHLFGITSAAVVQETSH